MYVQFAQIEQRTKSELNYKCDEPIMDDNKPKRDKTPIFHSRKTKIWNSN